MILCILFGRLRYNSSYPFRLDIPTLPQNEELNDMLLPRGYGASPAPTYTGRPRAFTPHSPKWKSASTQKDTCKENDGNRMGSWARALHPHSLPKLHFSQTGLNKWRNRDPPKGTPNFEKKGRTTLWSRTSVEQNECSSSPTAEGREQCL